jgi:hypothetical protein
MVGKAMRILPVLAALGMAACSGEPPPAAQPEPAPEAEIVIASMEGATCAVVEETDDARVSLSTWDIRECLRELATRDWAQASAEAKHIEGWELGYRPLAELTASLSRYESSDAVREALEARGLLNGPGWEYNDEFEDDGRVPVTAEDWLRLAGNYYWFDAETGMWPNHHDHLMTDLAKLYGEPVANVEFIETAQKDWDSEAPYVLNAMLGSRTWEREAANYGDWYDLGTVFTMLNEIAADLGSEQRMIALETYDQTVIAVVGPGDALAEAARDGLIIPAGSLDSMERGKAFEEEIRRAYGL